MDVHTWQCIWFIAMSGWIQNAKWIQNVFENKFENGFEVKEKKDKRELENKRVLKVAKFIFENLPKVLILFWIEKYIWNYIWICIWFIIEFGFENKIEKKKDKPFPSPLSSFGPAGLPCPLKGPNG